MNKQKKYIILIIILLVLVAIVQYKILKIAPGNANNIKTDFKNNEEILDYNIDDIKISDINLPPQKKETYTEPKIFAKNYILVDANSFYTLTEKDSNAYVPIASTTKIMTAIIVLENYNLNEVITVSEKACNQIGSSIFLRKNETISIENLLFGLLISSGNDSAMALAENIGLPEFVDKMNEKAKSLNLDNTVFKDPAGLDDNGKSSAKDLAILTAYALKNDDFRRIIKISDLTIYSEDKKITHTLKGSNRLVTINEPLFYKYALGVKTGFTPEAGHCLVAAAEKEDNMLISVVLNTSYSSKDASARESKKLLEWGFENYNFQ